MYEGNFFGLSERDYHQFRDQSRDFIFVVGCARSGTSIVTDILNRSKDCFMLYEDCPLVNTELSEDYRNWYNRMHGIKSLAGVKGYNMPSFGARNGNWAYYYSNIKNIYPRFGTKLTIGPSTHSVFESRFLDFFGSIFPRSQFVLTLRSPRDNFHSLQKLFPSDAAGVLVHRWIFSLSVLGRLACALDNVQLLRHDMLNAASLMSVAAGLDLPITVNSATIVDHTKKAADSAEPVVGVPEDLIEECEQLYEYFLAHFDKTSRQLNESVHRTEFGAQLMRRAEAVSRDIGEAWRVGWERAETIPANKASAQKPAVTSGDLVVLPATRYAKYALPLDYPPSRDLRPRWGNTHPPIPLLHEWFRAHAPRYDAFLDEMKGSVAALDTVPQQFRAEQLPEPAWFGVPFAPVDSLALYTMVRQRRPQTYIEIGSGISTCFVAKAVRDNSLPTRIVSIDPAPRAAIDGICDEVIREGLETCDLDRFAALQPNDILFFDGSHRSFMNSDVTVFMIDVLPRLQPGVIVHVHDVSLPWDYPPLFVDWYWNEQYLLAAYMIGARERLDPILPTAFVCRDEAFAARMAQPFIDFGEARLNSGWRGGGSMWFAHL